MLIIIICAEYFFHCKIHIKFYFVTTFQILKFKLDKYFNLLKNLLNLKRQKRFAEKFALHLKKI